MPARATLKVYVSRARHYVLNDFCDLRDFCCSLYSVLLRLPELCVFLLIGVTWHVGSQRDSLKVLNKTTGLSVVTQNVGDPSQKFGNSRLCDYYFPVVLV